MELKDKILTTSLNLFNQHGYKHVTIRQIAEELGISSGHLNYHYKKRVDILEALYFQMFEVFEDRVRELPKTDATLRRLKSGLEQSTQWMIDYKFFWTDLYTLIPLSEKIREHFKNLYENRVNGYSHLIQSLKDKRLMNDIKDHTEKTLLIKNLIDRGNTWLYSAEIYGEIVDSKLLNSQVNRLALPLLPYLTRRGRKEFYSVFRF